MAQTNQSCENENSAMPEPNAAIALDPDAEPIIGPERAVPAPTQQVAAQSSDFPGFLGADNTPGCKYFRERILGRGSFGCTWTVLRASDRKRFAMKVLDLSKMSSNAHMRCRTEVTCLANCEHFNIVQFVEDTQINGHVLIVMEHCDAGDLHHQIRYRAQQKQRLSERDTLLIFVQLCLAMEHIHSRRMLHRDVKSANVLLSTQGLVKLGDFGLSRAFDNTVSGEVAKTFCGTPYYLAPEVWRRQKYGSKADVWAMGVVLYEMVVGTYPFLGSSIEELKRQTLECDVPAIPSSCSTQLQQLIRGMLCKDPVKRMNVMDVLQTPIIHETLEFFPQAVAATDRVPVEQRARIVETVRRLLSIVPAPVHPVPLEGDVLCEGPVDKLRDDVFVARYLVLRTTGLEIHKNSEKQVRPAHPLLLSKIECTAPVAPSACAGVQNVWALHTTDGSSYYFRTASLMERDRWLDALHLAIETASNVAS